MLSMRLIILNLQFYSWYLGISRGQPTFFCCPCQPASYRVSAKQKNTWNFKSKTHIKHQEQFYFSTCTFLPQQAALVITIYWVCPGETPSVKAKGICRWRWQGHLLLYLLLTEMIYEDYVTVSMLCWDEGSEDQGRDMSHLSGLANTVQELDFQMFDDSAREGNAPRDYRERKCFCCDLVKNQGRMNRQM